MSGTLPLVALAPMSGLTDRPFRQVARRFGALIVTEMVASDGLVTRRDEDQLRAEADTPGAPLVVQLAGCQTRWLADAARCAEGNGATAIDINMGCPAKKVVGGFAGSALMRDLDHAAALIEATVAATALPVSVKMRLGWDDSSHNAAELTRRARDLGVRRVAVHGRTRCQFYKGNADWRAVRPVTEVLDVEVLVNGDIDGTPAAREALAQSGAHGVMVGRAAIGRPWLLGEIADGLAGRAHIAPDADERRALAVMHARASLEFYGPRHGLIVFRKHLSAYLTHAGVARADVANACRCEDFTGVIAALEAAFGESGLKQAA